MNSERTNRQWSNNLSFGVERAPRAEGQNLTTEEYIDAYILQHDFLTYFQHRPFPEHFPFITKLPKRYYLESGCIIDLETTGLIPLLNHVITMGILERNRAVIHQLTVPKYMGFRDYCSQKAKETQEPRYAYNARFESEFLQIKNGWHDLMQYRDFPDLSESRGLEIAKAKESQIRRINSVTYKVHSQSIDCEYAVYLSEDQWRCECPHYRTYGVKCKHIWAVEFSLNVKEHEQVKKNLVIIHARKSLGQCTSSAFKEPNLRGSGVPQIWQQWLIPKSKNKNNDHF